MADYADLLAAEHAKKPDKTPVSPAKSTPQKNENPETAKPSQLTPLRHDVMTAPRHEVDYRAWRDIIENTETLNSALRLTREERYEVEDMIQDLDRKHKIKTSMNEVARLGLLSIIRDYKNN